MLYCRQMNTKYISSFSGKKEIGIDFVRGLNYNDV